MPFKNVLDLEPAQGIGKRPSALHSAHQGHKTGTRVSWQNYFITVSVDFMENEKGKLKMNDKKYFGVCKPCKASGVKEGSSSLPFHECPHCRGVGMVEMDKPNPDTVNTPEALHSEREGHLRRSCEFVCPDCDRRTYPNRGVCGFCKKD